MDSVVLSVSSQVLPEMRERLLKLIKCVSDIEGLIGEHENLLVSLTSGQRRKSLMSKNYQ